jgi:hypothetical protein
MGDNNMTFREAATPLTIGSFLIIAVTGILMFFHLDSGLNKLAHEWLGWAMLAAVALHASVHFKSFSRYFTRPRALAVIGASAILLAASFISPSGKSSKPPHILAAQAVLDAPIRLVADMTGRDSGSIVRDLASAGFSADAESSLRSVAGKGREDQMKVLGIALAQGSSL